jgi:xanthine dehydrogenase YagS FAD-binding subunit
VDRMKEGIATPAGLINLLALKDLATIADDPAEGLAIGPLATLDAIANHPMILARYPLLARAAGEAATPQLRNVATIGGNLCQRPRCWYFRSADFPCLKKGGDTCFAVEGDNRYHAIFGGGPCHIVSPSSTGLALAALAAGIETASADGGRVLTAEQFFTMPDLDVARENALKPGEVVSRIRVLPPVAGSAFALLRVREKESHDWPLAEVAVVLVKEAGGAVKSARIVLGAAAPVPWRALAAENVLAGKAVTEKSAEAAGEAAVQGAKPMSGNAYKVALFREVVKRAILKAV